MLLVLLYSLTNHSLLVLVEAFIHSRPPGRRMVSRDMANCTNLLKDVHLSKMCNGNMQTCRKSGI